MNQYTMRKNVLARLKPSRDEVLLCPRCEEPILEGQKVVAPTSEYTS